MATNPQPRKGETVVSVMMVNARVKADKVGEVEAAARKMFAALQHKQPGGVRYASCKLSDGVTFVAILELEDNAQNPLPTIPEFTEFQAGLQGWVAEPPSATLVQVVGSYRLFGEPQVSTE
jgi:hypothetical protein